MAVGSFESLDHIGEFASEHKSIIAPVSSSRPVDALWCCLIASRKNHLLKGLQEGGMGLSVRDWTNARWFQVRAF
ncbi:hypothetical protein SCFA_1500002 [anaerobic digester metagenome]|jgi:hypothetical protein|uniref:Uncharacterized protein n=1 Tax=anaerobic digester metagenome TaxID=1263854 RepID=A0A485LZ30_9ZZZZ